MKSNGIVCMLAGLLALAPAAFGQRWEVGGGGGGGFYNSQSITNPSAGNADAKIAAGPAAGVWLGYNSTNHWSGEVRYDVQLGDYKLTSGSTEAKFGSAAHTFHYDFHYNFLTPEDRIRPYVSFGAGVKFYQGTGTEVAVQPLSRIALLSKGADMRPVGTFGAGIKARLNEHWLLRAGIQDFLSPLPTHAFTPNLNSKANGWFNDIVPMAGISYIF